MRGAVIPRRRGRCSSVTNISQSSSTAAWFAELEARRAAQVEHYESAYDVHTAVETLRAVAAGPTGCWDQDVAEEAGDAARDLVVLLAGIDEHTAELLRPVVELLEPALQRVYEHLRERPEPDRL